MNQDSFGNPLKPSLSNVSVVSLKADPNAEVSTNDIFFPFCTAFLTKTRKDKEQLFLKAYDQQINQIRNKELKCEASLGQKLLEPESITSIAQSRDAFFDTSKNRSQRDAISIKETVSDTQPAPRVETSKNPTFDTLLNINYGSQQSLLDIFKSAVSHVLLKTRAKTRAQKLTQFLNSGMVPNEQKVSIDTKITPEYLLGLNILCAETLPEFYQKMEIESPQAPTLSLEAHRIERQMPYYNPGLVEKYQLTKFGRVEMSVFNPITINPPETFPVVYEEQPILERVKPVINGERPLIAYPQQLQSSMIPSTVIYPRDPRFFSFDLVSLLKPEQSELPPIANEIGKASILSLPLTEYETMSIFSKTRTPVSPFSFAGVQTKADPRFKLMNGPDSKDLKELEADDDVDGIDIVPKARPITDFIQKPTSTTNKSHTISEAVLEGQSHWRERQRKNTKDLIDKINNINQLIKDQTMALTSNDLNQYLQQ